MTNQADASGDVVRARLGGPTIGCGDAFALAEFYAAMLGWKVVARSETVPGGWAVIRSPSGEEKIEFQREEPFVPPVWPTVAGEQQMGMHLDFGVEGCAYRPNDSPSDMEQRQQRYAAFKDRLISLGAREAEYQPQAARGVLVMLDPAGHPFCVSPA